MTDLEKKLWQKVRRYVGFLRILPFVRMVAVCNNLAFGNINKESDIDLFVVARGGRLFTVRILVTFMLHVLGVRRHDDKVAGRFCLSFFVDDKFLDLSQIAIQKDIYLAYWIKSMIPLIDDGVSTEFLSANDWARTYFEGVYDFKMDKSRVITGDGLLSKLSGWILGGRIGDFFEKKMKKWQLVRAKQKAVGANEGASLIIDEHILKFHNIDRRREYRNKWFRKYGGDVKLLDERFLSL